MTTLTSLTGKAKRSLVIPEVAREELIEIARQAAPYEAGGILFPEPVDGSWVMAIFNKASDELHRYEFDREELLIVGSLWVEEPEDWEHLTLWHSHPSGLVGPSSYDMKHRIPQMGNLVISLPDGELSWF